MKHILSKLMVMPVLFIVLCACDNSSNAEAQAAKLEQSFTQELHSKLEGLIPEKQTTKRVSISLDQDGEKVTGTLVIGESTERNYIYLPLNTDIAMEGTFDPLLGYARLKTKSGSVHGEVIVEIAQSPKGAMAVFSPAGQYGNKGAPRGNAFLLPASESKYIDHIQKTVSETNVRKFEAITGTCPKNVQTWISKAHELAKSSKYKSQDLRTLDLPEFKTAFGQSYDKIDAPNILKAVGLLRGACEPESYADRTHVRQLTNNIASYKTVKFRKASLPIAQSWSDNIINLLSSDVRMDKTQLDSIKTHYQTFRLGSHYINYRSDVDPLVRERKKVLKQEEIRLSRLDMMDDQKDRFDLLHVIAQAQISEYPDTKDLVMAKMDEYGLGAAQIYAENAKRADDLQYMASFSEQSKKGVGCIFSSQSTCKKIGKIFDKKAYDLSYELSEKLAQDAASKIPAGTDISALAQHVKFAQHTKSRYRNALEVGGLEKQKESLTKTRQKLQKNLYKELYTLVDKAQNANAVVQIENKYFIDDDIKQRSMKKIDAMLSKKLEKLAPFRNLQGGEYLNALVSRDTRTLQELDQEYTQGFKPFLKLTGNVMSMIRSDMKASFDDLAQNFSAVNAVFGTYLLNYQDTYPNCLGENPIKAIVTEETTEIKKNGYGLEISRTSWTEEDEYLIPRHLGPHFERLWRADFRDGDTAMSDALFNDEKIGTLLRGLKQATKTYPCDHPNIKALERGMISYYSRFSR